MSGARTAAKRRMHRVLAVVAVGASIASSALVATGRGQWETRAGVAACDSGPRVARGMSAQAFCGPARATVVVNRRRITFRSGVCERHSKYFLVNIGTAVSGLGTRKPQPPYFGLVMGRSPAYSEPVVNKPGTYHQGLITVNARGMHIDLHDEQDLTIVLGPGLRAGRFSATKPASPIYGTPAYGVAGSFTC
jgi:hypothetical protein